MVKQAGRERCWFFPADRDVRRTDTPRSRNRTHSARWVPVMPPANVAGQAGPTWIGVRHLRVEQRRTYDGNIFPVEQRERKWTMLGIRNRNGPFSIVHISIVHSFHSSTFHFSPPSKVYQIDNIPTPTRCETSPTPKSVINLMARGLHNRAFSSVFAEVYRT
jgi:hypothetical protein